MNGKIRSVHRQCALLVIILLLSGCGFAYYQQASEKWDKAKAYLGTRPTQEDLLKCSETPDQIGQQGESTFIEYSVRESIAPMGTEAASMWCNVSIELRNSRVSKFSYRSGNPGGMTDGSATCGYLFGRCVGGTGEVGLTSSNRVVIGNRTYNESGAASLATFTSQLSAIAQSNNVPIANQSSAAAQASNNSAGQGSCNSTKEECAIQSCRRAGGIANPHTENGCRYVSCRFPNHKDTSKDYANLISKPAGSGCAGMVK